MPFFEHFNFIMRMLWTGSVPGTRIAHSQPLIRIVIFVVVSYSLCDLVMNVVDDIKYTLNIWSDYEETTCTLLKYSFNSIVIPYGDSLNQGSCSHLFHVSFPNPNQNLEEKDVFGIIPDLTYGLCNEKSRLKTNWKSTGEIIDTHSCYYDRKNFSLIMIALPPLKLGPRLLKMGGLLFLPGVLWGATLVWLVMLAYYHFAPPRNNDNALAEAGAGGVVAPVDGGDGAAAVAGDGGRDGGRDGGEGGGGGGSNNSGRLGGRQQHQRQGQQRSQQKQPQQHLSAAQQQMVAQGWVIHPEREGR